MLQTLFKKKPTLPNHPLVLFLHIQKTAGTSIVNHAVQATPFYGQSFIAHGDYMGHSPDDFKETHFIAGHMGYAFSKTLMPDRFTFTFLRNPNERILSLYYYLKSTDPDESIMTELAHQLSLSQFLAAGLYNPVVKLHIWNNQVWQLASGYGTNIGKMEKDYKLQGDYSGQSLLNLARLHLSEFSYVGFTETFEKDAINIFSALNIEAPDQINQLNATPHPAYEDLSEYEKTAMDKLTALDWHLYKYARKIYAK